MTRIAMIPARLGSERVPRKNLRYLGDKPLLQHVVETVRDSQLFDAVYVNSESSEILDLARTLGVDLYLRDDALAKSSATSEHFVRDFIEKTIGDVFYQVLPTSPFLSVDDLRRAVDLSDHFDTVIPVRKLQTECVYQMRPVNFDDCAPMLPSQQLAPVFALCNGVFAWRRDSFLRFGCYGITSERTLLVLSGDSTIDIDTEADFEEAEAVIARRRLGAVVPRYWTSTAHAEISDLTVLEHDGVPDVVIDKRNDRLVSIKELLALISSPSFAHRVIQSPSNVATLIGQQPGEGNRRHYHPDVDEWWFIVEGQYEYEIEGQTTRYVNKGDIVFIPRGNWHQIKATGSGRATRLAVSRLNAAHVYHD